MFLSVESEFSKYAKDYDDNNIIQRIVSRALVREIQTQPKNILELGCGSGQIYRQIDWQIDNYLAIDFSKNMCDLHPRSKNVDVQCYDFDSDVFYKSIQDRAKSQKFDMVISSSALQWSKDIDLLLKRIFSVSHTFHGVLFTSNTFKSIYEITKEPKKILSLLEITNAFKPYNATFEVFEYKINFDSKKELFEYIKNSGVKGESNLSYAKAKELYKKYPHLYLEFEVVFVKTT